MICQRIFSLFLKITLLATEFWIDRFFFFLSRLFFCCHLASMISGERYSVMSFIIPLCVACHSSLDLFYLWLLALWPTCVSVVLSLFCSRSVELLVDISDIFRNGFLFSCGIPVSVLLPAVIPIEDSTHLSVLSCLQILLYSGSLQMLEESVRLLFSPSAEFILLFVLFICFSVPSLLTVCWWP